MRGHAPKLIADRRGRQGQSAAGRPGQAGWRGPPQGGLVPDGWRVETRRVHRPARSLTMFSARLAVVASSLLATAAFAVPGVASAAPAPIDQHVAEFTPNKWWMGGRRTLPPPSGPEFDFP